MTESENALSDLLNNLSISNIDYAFQDRKVQESINSNTESNLNIKVFEENLKKVLETGTVVLSISNTDNLITDMAQFKPEYLNCVPEFDGNPSELNRFLATCKSDRLFL